MARRLTNNNTRLEQRRQERLLLLMERRFRRVLAAEIQRATLEMLARFRATGQVPALPDDHVQRLTDIFRDMAEMGVEAFGSRIVGQGKSLGLILERKEFAEFFRRLATDYIGLEAIRQRIVNIGETTRAQIISQVLIGQAEGLGTEVIARRISEAVPGIARFRGERIARTETHGAANYGADGAARATGLKLRKEWVAASDERTREAHRLADGTVVDMDQPFLVDGERLMFPGDPNGSAGNIINCRCGVSHIVDDGIS